MNYEELLILAESENLVVKEKPLGEDNGRIKGKRIAIRQNIDTSVEKACVLAEELGHYYTTTGDILDQSEGWSRKQEYRARLRSYNLMIGLSGIIHAYEEGCRSHYAMAEILGVTEEYLEEALNCYRSKYGVCTNYEGYTIFFIPSLAIYKREFKSRPGHVRPISAGPAEKPAPKPESRPEPSLKPRRRRRLSGRMKQEKEKQEFLAKIGKLPEPKYLLDKNVILENHMVIDDNF